MLHPSDLKKIAFVGNCIPRRCGLATFTHDSAWAIERHDPDAEVLIAAVEDGQEEYAYPDLVRFTFAERDVDAYRRAADYLNYSSVDVVSLQHEYGIYGGDCGDHILTLLEHLRRPVVTTCHTILEEPSTQQWRTLRRIAGLIAMSERGKALLHGTFQVPLDKIQVIPHGIPDTPFIDPAFHKARFDAEGRFVLLTFGLLSPNKGIETVIRALPAIAERHPSVVYLVVGATHPNLVREQGEAYRAGLIALAEGLGVAERVRFFNQFVGVDEILGFLGAADVYITSYLNPAQITSGTLAYAFGCGKAVVSTPYWHAEELLADGRGVLVPFRDEAATAEAVSSLLGDGLRRHAMRKRGWQMGREMIWPVVAERMMDVFLHARTHPGESDRPIGARAGDGPGGRLAPPPIKCDHLLRMTDSCGMLQHATFAVPNFGEGYCVDDNARALLLTVRLEELGQSPVPIQRAASTYAAFLQYGFNHRAGRFRNVMTFDRCWLEDVGSDDAHGRGVWALGECVGRSERRDLQFWAVPLFRQALRGLLSTTSIRAWADGLIGCAAYGQRLAGDREVEAIQNRLIDRMLGGLAHFRRDDWAWFEDRLTYGNAVLPHGVIAAGVATGRAEVLAAGLETLRWLTAVQTGTGGCFRPIGSHGFYLRGGERAEFDQQPLEAYETVAACLAAYRATGEDAWRAEAWRAFAWFLGRNDLGLPLVDATTGGCCDGLHPGRVNQNQGAESTLSYLLALAEMHLATSGREPSLLPGARPSANNPAAPRPAPSSLAGSRPGPGPARAGGPRA